MRYLLLLLLFVFLTSGALSRPAPTQVENVEDNEGDEAEYEADAAAAGDDLEDEQEQRAGRDESAVDDEAADEFGPGGQASNENSQRSADAVSRVDNNNLSGYKTSKNYEDEPNDQLISNNEYQSASEQRDSGKFVDKNLVDHRRFTNRDDSLKTLRDDKSPVYTQSAVSNEEGDALFERHENSPGRRERTNKNDYEKPSNSQYRYVKQTQESLQEGASDENKYSNINSERDRRAVNEMNDTGLMGTAVKVNEQNNAADVATADVNTPSSAKDAAVITNVAEDEEAAIKRHVKKLSSNELQELLGSLTEDKRQLLKKIMDSDGESNNVKRDITKKAGAAPDDNSYLESGQSESNKLQEVSVGPELNLQSTSTDPTDLNNKQNNAQPSDVSALPVTSKSSETNSSSYSSLQADISKSSENAIDSNNQGKSQSNMIQAPLTDSNNQAAPTQTKRENKREAIADVTSLEDKEQKSFDSDVANEFEYCPQDEDLLEIDDDKSEFNSKDGNSLKREAPSEKDMSDSIKSLEESFPNSNSYEDDDPLSNSDLAPLVRVKRKNSDLILKKRGANIMPDAKVAFFPYRAENDDEDNDEGNEFDDEGFYDRTSNLAKNEVKDTLSEEGTPPHLEDPSLRQKSESKHMKQDSQLMNNNMESDTAHLGSDSDSVLSGVEGIDENLMLNSASRNRRATAEEEKPGPEYVENAAMEQTRLARSTALDGEIRSVTDNYANVPIYQEKDAFGALPRNYEGDLPRNKRIRRVKQPAGSASLDFSSNT